METFHLKDYTIQTLDFKAQLNFSVFNPRFEQAQRMLGEHILTASQSRMPIRTGALKQLSHTEDGGRRIVFPGPYARFQWGGKVMVDPETGAPFTAHTTNPVPFIVVADNVGWIASDGALCDIAPTLLTLAGMEIPAEMTGTPLVKLK